jgi:hypothetical protein
VCRGIRNSSYCARESWPDIIHGSSRQMPVVLCQPVSGSKSYSISGHSVELCVLGGGFFFSLSTCVCYYRDEPSHCPLSHFTMRL